jgi:flagellar biosynthesis chaperone FliJ
MEKLPKYPLEQVLEVKKKRVDDAEKVVVEKRKFLEKEQEKLLQCERERDQVKNHYNDKLTQLREELDKGANTAEIQIMKRYLDVVKEKLAKEQAKVAEQQIQVQNAQKQLDEAQAALTQRRLEADKIEMHRKEWLKEVRKEMQIAQEKTEDEIGSIIYQAKHKPKE